MGHACAKGFPIEYEEAIAGRLNGKWRPNHANTTAPAKETTGSEVDEESNNSVNGKPQQMKPQVHKFEDDDFINSLLGRANAAGGNQERLTASLAAAPDVHDDGDSEASEDDGKIHRLLGGPFPAKSSIAPVSMQDAMLDFMNGREREKLTQPQKLDPRSKSGGDGPLGMASLKAMGHSEQVVRAVARLGVPLPSTRKEDEVYGTLDAIVDDVLGVPHSRRPKGWQQRPSIVDSEAALTGKIPDMIFEDGRRGPPLHLSAQRESIREKQLAQVLETNVSVPDSGRPSLVGRPSVVGRASWSAGATKPYLGNVLDGWSSIDGDEAGDKQQALPDQAAKILPEIDTLGALGAGAAGGVPRSHLGSAATASPQQPAPAPRGSFGKAMGMLRGATPRNSFGTGTTTAARDSSDASAQRPTIGGMPAAPRDGSGAAGTALLRGSLRPASTAAAQNIFGGPLPHVHPGAQQVEVSQRVADANRPSPKRKAQAR